MSRLLSEEAAAPTLASLAANIASVKGDLSATKGSVDTFYFITVGALVFFMQAGFGMLKAGDSAWEKLFPDGMPSVLDFYEACKASTSVEAAENADAAMAVLDGEDAKKPLSLRGRRKAQDPEWTEREDLHARAQATDLL